MVSVVTGVGLIVAGDASKSAQAHEETLSELDKIKTAVKTGDTSFLTKPNPPTTGTIT